MLVRWSGRPDAAKRKPPAPIVPSTRRRDGDADERPIRVSLAITSSFIEVGDATFG
jgi:hypothetical protein